MLTILYKFQFASTKGPKYSGFPKSMSHLRCFNEFAFLQPTADFKRKATGIPLNERSHHVIQWLNTDVSPLVLGIYFLHYFFTHKLYRYLKSAWRIFHSERGGGGGKLPCAHLCYPGRSALSKAHFLLARISFPSRADLLEPSV